MGATRAQLEWQPIVTAAAYGFGRSEEVIGKALKQWSKPVTKCGVLDDGQGGAANSLRADSIIKEVEGSLRRLQLETIDLYQIHWPRPEEEVEEGFETLLKLKKQGKIRFAGVSNFSAAQLERAKALGSVTSLQPPYNLLKREIEPEILPWCAKNNTGVVAYSPMECGLLTGKFSQSWIDSLPATDWRKARWGRLCAINYFEEPELSALVGWVDKLKEISSRHDRPVSHLALAWVLRRTEVTSAIVGARKKGQIMETAAAADWILSEAEVVEIENSYQAYQQQMGRA